jgi:hypothetical protein
MGDALLITAALSLAGFLMSLVWSTWRRGGLRQLIWPTFQRGYEIENATRLAVVPWAIVLLLAVLNAARAALGGRDFLGSTFDHAWIWVLVAAVAIFVARQINRRRSRGAAALSFAAVSLAVLDLVVNVGPGAWLVLALFFVLWSFNGLRATLVHGVMG